MNLTGLPERIVDLIQAEGVDTIFGIPDPSLFAMFLSAQARGMNVISPHHEQGGALMADGYFRLSGRPAVLGVNKGPGVANIAAGAAYLAKENVPAIFIMGQRQRIYEQRVRRGKMQYLSQPSLFAGSMKYIGVIEYPEQVDEIFHEAFRRALSGVPGPAYVELPLSVMQARLDFGPVQSPHRYRLTNQEAGSRAVTEATSLLKDAQSPIILLGQGAFVSRAHAAVARLARRLACPIIQTQAAEAVLEGLEDITFPYGSTAASLAIDAADVVVAIGTEIGEALHYGRGRHWAAGDAQRRWIYIERDSTAIGVNRPIDVPLVGDLRDVLPQLTTALEGVLRTPATNLREWTQLHALEATELLASVPTTSQPIHTARLAVEATRVLPGDTVIVRDGGASGMYFAALLQLRPRDALWNSNYGAIGPGLPYAIGAQIAVGPNRRVVLLTGDSSIMFHIAEFETAVRKKLPVVCVVAVDHAWGIEVASYKATFGSETSTPEAKWGSSVRLDKAAEAFGAYGEYVDRAEEIAPAVQRALASGKPALVHVEIDAEANSVIADIPGFLEFRTWYGEEGDNLGVLGSAPTGPEDRSAGGSGY